jgi:hypothetical protein
MLPTPTELLIKLDLYDPIHDRPEHLVDATLAEELSLSKSASGDDENGAEYQLIQEMRENLSQKHPFVVFWETSNQLSSKARNPHGSSSKKKSN